MEFSRSSGILLHISSLPGPYGIGDLGPSAYRFADFLESSGQHIWQVLPLVPVGKGYSPYSSPSTFAGNPLLISPDLLIEDGLLLEEDVRQTGRQDPDKIDYGHVSRWKSKLLKKAFEQFENGDSSLDEEEFDRFCKHNGYWLKDYAVFMTLGQLYNGASWTNWPRSIVKRRPRSLAKVCSAHAETIRSFMFQQYLFFRQWNWLKIFCKKRSIFIFGDLPIVSRALLPVYRPTILVKPASCGAIRFFAGMSCTNGVSSGGHRDWKEC